MGTRYKDTYIRLICIYLIALPLGAMSIGTIGSALKLIAILPMLIALLNIRTLFTCIPIKRYFFYVLICGISVLYALDESAAWSKYSSLLLLFLLLVSSCFFKYSGSDISKLKKALIWSSRISVVLCMMFNNYVEGRMYFRSGTFSEDPNYFCAYLAFGVIYTIERVISHKGIKHKIFPIIELAAYLTVALLTGSRGGTIALLFGAILFIFFSNGNIANIKTLFMIATIAIVLYFGVSFLSEEILSRFTIQDVMATGGTGRFDIWAKALNLFKESNAFRKLFGQGIGNTVTSWSHYGISEFHVCHNMFIESLLEIGVIGLVLYTSMIFSFIKVAFVQKEKYAFGVIIVMFFLSLSTSIATFKPYINIMLFILCITNCTEEQNEMTIDTDY